MIARQEVYALIFFFIAIVISACGFNRGGDSPLRFFESTPEQIKGVINEISGNDHRPNWPLEKSLYNDDYPMELSLYKDGVFHYHLPRLGTGKGTWKMEGGTLLLSAAHKIDWMDFTIDMNYEIGATDASGKSLRVKFSDRFGPQDLVLSKRNID